MFDWLKKLFSGNFTLSSSRDVDDYIRGIERDENGIPTNSPSGFLSNFFGSSFNDVLKALVGRLTGAHLTGAEQEANEFSAGEAQKSRDFTEYMTRNKYQMESQSMESAGLNPAMMYGGGNLVSTAANGAQANSVSPASEMDPFGIIMSMIRMPKELDKLGADAERARKEGDAALISARASERQADASERQAGASERQASVAEIRAQIDRELADSQIGLNEEQRYKLAADAAYITKQTDLLDDYLQIEQIKADAATLSALASLKSALAAQQNADTNTYLSGYQAAAYQAQAFVDWANGEGQNIVNQYLPDSEKQRLENLGKEGKVLDREAANLRSKTIMTYVTGASVALKSVVECVPFFSKMPKIGL